jgi:hypothetical protein
MPTKITNESSDGFEELSQLLRERAVRRQRLHEAAVQLTVAIAALDRIVSSLLDVGEELKKTLDETDEPDDCSSTVP